MTISRLSLPNDFQDNIATRMLYAPVPAFFLARLLRLAGVQFNLERLRGQDMGITPERSPKNSGAPIPQLQMMQLMLEDQTGQSGVIMVSDDLKSEGSGHTARFIRPVFAGGGYSISARRLATGAAVSTVPIDFGTEQVYLTLERLAGPYDTTNNRVAPYCIDLLDATRAIHDLAQLAATNLEYDFENLCDTVLNLLLEAIANSSVNSLTNTVWPGRGKKTADSQLATPGDSPLDYETLTRGAAILDARNIRRLPNGKYMALIRPEAEQQLILDSDYKAYAKYFPDKNPLFASYIGENGQFMFYRSTTLTQDTTTVANNTINHGFILGMEALGFAEANPIEILKSTDDNYGQQAKFIWRHFAAYGALDNRNAIGVHTD